MNVGYAAALSVTFQFLPAGIGHAEVGKRTFFCIPTEAYELTAEGLRMASQESYDARVVDREFMFNEGTAIKSEPKSSKATQYTILNPDNLMGSPVVAKYGSLNPTILRIQMIDESDPNRFVFVQFGGGMNVFGNCKVQQE